MADRYENIRKALEMGPTPGPWKVWDDVIYYDNGNFQVLRHLITAHEVDVVGAYGVEADRPSANADAAHIAACDPDTIRELLKERDALLADKARMDWLEHATRSCTTYADGSRAFNFTSLDLRHLRGPTLRAAIDAAIAAANGGGND